jgi:hypothetical protein
VQWVIVLGGKNESNLEYCAKREKIDALSLAKECKFDLLTNPTLVKQNQQASNDNHGHVDR